MMTYTRLAPLPVRILVSQPNRPLFCDVCGTWTAHALNESGTAYVCGCGSQIMYLINNAPEQKAIRL